DARTALIRRQRGQQGQACSAWRGFFEVNNCVLNPAPAEAQRLAVPGLDTVTDESAHALRQNRAARLLNHLGKPGERACDCRISGCPEQVIGQYRIRNEPQRAPLLEAPYKPLARRCAQQATGHPLQSRWQRKECIPQEHIDHAVDVVECYGCANDLWSLVRSKWWRRHTIRIRCPLCQYPLHEGVQLLIVD